MEVKDFIDRCIANNYEWQKGEYNGNEGYFIRCRRLGTKVHVTEEAIEANKWERLDRGVVQGKDVYHVTRIVGYYSRIHNWNKSKLGELADRHRGEYIVKQR